LADLNPEALKDLPPDKLDKAVKFIDKLRGEK
jgi:hypothetical protein